MQIDFSQMHCGRDAVIDRMTKLIDLAAERGAVSIDGILALVSRNLFVAENPNAEISNHEFFVCDKGRQVGIDTPEELKQILSQWGYL
jgi:hypothetical protein